MSLGRILQSTDTPHQSFARRATVLLVDDTPINIQILKGLLEDDYHIIAASNGEEALRATRALPKPDIILLDVMMPGLDGYAVCKKLKDDAVTSNIPVIFITAMYQAEDEKKGLDLGAVDYIVKPFSPPIVKARIRTHLALYDQSRTLEQKVKERTEELSRIRLELIHRLGRAAEYRDNETGLHVIRMSHYSRLIGDRLGLDDVWVDTLFTAAPMHDIGKIGIPDNILLKPGPLDMAEWAVMRQHPIIGADIIGRDSSELMQLSHEIALAHHEKWDGSGYPSGLKGEAIPLSARVVAVADVFDALTTERPYKKAWTVEKAVAYIREHSGQHFDPRLVEIFNEVLADILDIKNIYREF